MGGAVGLAGFSAVASSPEEASTEAALEPPIGGVPPETAPAPLEVRLSSAILFPARSPPRLNAAAPGGGMAGAAAAGRATGAEVGAASDLVANTIWFAASPCTGLMFEITDSSRADSDPIGRGGQSIIITRAAATPPAPP